MLIEELFKCRNFIFGGFTSSETRRVFVADMLTSLLQSDPPEFLDLGHNTGLACIVLINSDKYLKYN